MAITLDGAESPPCARLVGSLVNHGGQPHYPDPDAVSTGVGPVNVITLVVIVDLHAPGYLTAPGYDHGREEMTDEDFFRIRTTTPRPRSDHIRVPEPRPRPDPTSG